jgi:Holliday junction resolvase-like predicted endonuclease
MPGYLVGGYVILLSSMEETALPPNRSVPPVPPPRRQEAAMRGFKAEELIARLFQALGYQVDREATISGAHIDIVASKDGTSTLVEVVSTADSRNILNKLRADAARLQSVISIGNTKEAVIAVIAPLSSAAKEWSENQFDLSVWDIGILLGKAAPFQDLHEEIKELTSFSTHRPAKPDNDSGADFIIELANHIRKKCTYTPSQYEDLCQRVFTYVFDPTLYGFKKQAHTSDGANRYDFICRIRSGQPFWDDLRADFHTKALLFECKNYDEKITADRVYSRLGPDEGCIRAAQGAMRESGKLILLLSNQDLIELIKLKPDDGGPEDYLDEKIWNFVISLPR